MRMQTLMAGSMMNRFGLGAHACFATDADVGDVDGLDDFSLADLADLDVSEIAEIRFETLPPGVVEWEVKTAKLEEGQDKEGVKRFTATFELEVLEYAVCTDRQVDKASLVGKTHKEIFYISPGKGPQKMQEALGRLLAFITDMGAASEGPLGTKVDNTMGHRFKSKLVHRPDQQDPTIKRARIQLDAAKKG